MCSITGILGLWTAPHKIQIFFYVLNMPVHSNVVVWSKQRIISQAFKTFGLIPSIWQNRGDNTMTGANFIFEYDFGYVYNW